MPFGYKDKRLAQH